MTKTRFLGWVTFLFLLAAPLTVAAYEMAQPDVSGLSKGG